MLSEKRQKLYEAAGWERIKLELEVGDFHFVPVDTFARQEARDWAEAKEQQDRAAQETKLLLDEGRFDELCRRFDELRRWTIIVGVAAIVAAITGLIAVFK